MTRTAFVLAGLALAAVPPAGQAREHAADDHPELVAPALDRAPVIDGRIGEDEWGGAAAFTGMAAVGSGVGPYTLVPELQQVTWRIGYDGARLYLAMHSPHPEGTWPVTRVKDFDDAYHILWDDHTEIQICTGPPEEATAPPRGFYKIMTNAKDVVSDAHHFNGTPGTEDRWSFGGDVRSHVTDRAWEMEMAIPVRQLGLASLEGRTLMIQLVRADEPTGIYYAAWVPQSWNSWTRFARVTFRSDAPAVAFDRLGEIMAGRLDARVGVAAGGAPRRIGATLRVEDPSGRAVYEETRTTDPDAGATAELLWQAEVPVAAVDLARYGERNHVELRVVEQRDGGPRLLYRHRQPFVKLDEAYVAARIRPWVERRPKGDWKALAAYLPYANKLEATVDLDFFGLPPGVEAARRFAGEVRTAGGEVLARGAGAIADRTGERLLLDLPDLEDGGYEAVVRLLDDAGGPLDEKVVPFRRKHYPWEHNTLGLDDEVIPPYLPIAADPAARRLTLDGQGGLADTRLRRVLTLGADGLVGQALLDPPTGTAGAAAPLLAAPMRLEAVVDGAVVVSEGEGPVFTQAADHRVAFTAASRLGPLAASLEGFVDYDGWYQARLRVEGGAEVERLDLVADLRDTPDSPADTLYVQRMGGARYGNFLGGIPREAGVHFRSTDLLPLGRSASPTGKDWRSFVPNVLVGNGDRALQFHAWSDRGWVTSGDDPAVRVERLPDGTVRLRVRLVAGRTAMRDRPPVDFAFQFLPVKPNDRDYRAGGPRRYQDTSGWRYYGASVNGYDLYTDEDYDALRRFLLYGPRGQSGRSEARYAPGHNVDRHAAARGGGRVILYGSTVMTGLGMEESDTFGGEWMGDQAWTAPRNGVEYLGWWNYGGTRQWTADRQVSAASVNWTRSLVDHYVWNHRRLLRDAGVNGTWWDDSQLWTVREYDPDADAVLEVWNQPRRRELTKRLNVLGWRLARPPQYVQHAHTDYAWTQYFWMIEGDYYADGPDRTALQQMSLAEWRAMTRTRSTMLVPVPSLRHYRGTTPELDRKVRRSVAAVCLLHDVRGGAEGDGEFLPDALRRLVFAVDYENPRACLFRGYWRTGDAVRPPDPALAVSLYRHDGRRTAVAVIVNTAEGRDLDAAGTVVVPAALLGAAAADRPLRAYDLETWKDVPLEPAEGGGLRLAGPVDVPWHDVRLIAFEAE